MHQFPDYLLNPKQKALCLFCAAFGGEQDVKPLRQAGIKDITLVDHDQPKLLAMALDHEWIRVDDAFKFIEQLQSKFDIITSDQWTNQDQLIHENHLPKLRLLCKGWLILGISQTYIDTLAPNTIGNDVLIKRSNRNGGVYWRVIDCRPINPNDDMA